MSAVKSLAAQLSEKLAEMEVICAEFGYEVTPTLLLRHDRGPSFSLIIGNDDLNKFPIDPTPQSSRRKSL